MSPSAPSAPSITTVFEEERVLVCEGPDDARFYGKLIKKRNLPNFHVIPVKDLNGKTGGVRGFQPSMEAIGPLTSLSKVKLLLLAGDNERGVFSALRDSLRNNGFNYPGRVGKIAKSTKPNKPATSIVLLPTGRRGDLETVCLPLLYAKWKTAEKCIEAFLKCSGATKRKAGWTRSNLDKARLHAAIAGFNRADPEKILRDCFHSGLLDVEDEVFKPIAEQLLAIANAV
jgi:hypothetical protein